MAKERLRRSAAPSFQTVLIAAWSFDRRVAMRGKIRQMLLVWAALVLMVVGPGPALGHSGGLDSNGGHHCREAGHNSGKCSPLNSYHCHQAGCNPAGPGAGPSGGSGAGGNSPITSAPAGRHYPARQAEGGHPHG